MNVPNRNIIRSIAPLGPEASSHPMAVLLNWLALSVAVVVTLRVKSLVMFTRGFTTVATAVAPVVGSTIGANEVGPLLVNTTNCVNKLFLHWSRSP